MRGMKLGPLTTLRLTFTSGPVAGKKMIVQSTSTGGDLGNNHFDLNMPGGGVGIFDGCSPQVGGLAGQRYGGVSSRSECDSFPAALKPGCYWRFDWFKNADNPTFSFRQVQCPAELVARTGCRRADDSSFPTVAAPGGGSKPNPVAPSSSSSSSTSTSKAVPSSTSTPAAPPKPTTTSTSSVSPAKPTSTSTPPSQATPPATSPDDCVTEKWGQCGGAQFSGCTTCACGTTCKKQNDWYSQCL